MKKLFIILIFSLAAIVLGTKTAAAQYVDYNQGYYGYPQPTNYTYQPAYPYYPTPAPVSLSQTIVSLTPGQTTSITVYGNAPFSVSTNNPSVVWQSLTGNTLTIQGTNPGSTTLTVCSGGVQYYYNQGTCADVFVTVTNQYNYYPGYNNYNGSYATQTNTAYISVNESKTIYIANPPYYQNFYEYVSANSNPWVASATLNGSELVIAGLQPGTTQITINQNNSYQTVLVTVGNSNGGRYYHRY